ncbi:PEBP-like protein [Schizopora paradoxa]|uniref:PEBP-like protein n=1 Tax=Schizopora paradoxa TaxID=27342 RepID=A0A0H2S0A5_9AGAM|nr:PEBP-like protein [Schizopora paradoxa]
MRSIHKSLLSIAVTITLISSSTLVSAQDTSLAEVKAAFAKADVPEDAHITFEPNTLLEVAFPQASGRPVLVNAGKQLQQPQTAIPPRFGIKSPTASQLHQTFVVSMIDLDAPTPQNPNVSQIRHFLGSNFHIDTESARANRLSERFGVGMLVNSTEALSGFLQPTPPAGSDPHRYVFLLFEQPAGFNEKVGQFVNASTPITDFSIATFAKQVGLGNPLGGSFMLVGPGPNA